MVSAMRWAALLVALGSVPVLAQSQGYTLKQASTPVPKELDPSIQKLLGEAVEIRDSKGGLVAEFWFRKEVPVEANPDQLKAGITYREVPATTSLGAVRFHRKWSDYRKQTIGAGVYTIRLGFQPQDGDHMGTAPFPDFGVLLAASRDTKAGTMEPKRMQELSAASIGTSHPAVLLLFPQSQPKATPELAARENNHLVLTARESVAVDGKTAAGALGIALTLVGHAE